MKKILNYLFIFWKVIKHNWIGALAIILVLVVLTCLYWNYNEDASCNGAVFIWKTFDPVAGLGAFILSFIVLYNQAKSNYLDSLEKRLSVDYIFEDRIIMQVHEAYLSGESDIRAWAQQLGRQLSGGNLSMDIVIKTIEEAVLKADNDNNISFLHYKINMYLNADPRLKSIVETSDQRILRLENSDVDDKKIAQESEQVTKKPLYLLSFEKYTHSEVNRGFEDNIWKLKRIKKS